MLIIVGDPGSGKSYTGLGLCNLFDPVGFNEETLEKRCITKPKHFIDKIVDDEKDLQYGSALLLDEAGTSIPAREWASWNNKAVDYISQTFRYKRLLVVMTVPSMELVDVHIRKYFAYMFEAVGIDFSQNLNITKVFKISSSKQTGKIYYIFPRYKKDGKRVKITIFKFVRPKKELCDKYEEISREFKDKLAQELRNIGDKMEAKEIKRNVNIDDIVKKVLDNKKRYCKVYPSGIRVNKQLIEQDFALGGGYSTRVKKVVESQLAHERKIIELPNIEIKSIE